MGEQMQRARLVADVSEGVEKRPLVGPSVSTASKEERLTIRFSLALAVVLLVCLGTLAVQAFRQHMVATVNSKSSGEHFGLFSLRERMEAMGGSFNIQSAPGQGTTARLTLPFASAVGEEATTPVLSASSAIDVPPLLWSQAHPSMRCRL